MGGNVVEILARTDAFAGFPERALTRLAQQGERRVVRTGETLLREGEINPGLYVILGGRMEFRRRHPAISEPAPWTERFATETIPPLGALEHAPSPDTVVAAEETEVLALSCGTLIALLLEHPTRAAEALAFLSVR